VERGRVYRPSPLGDATCNRPKNGNLTVEWVVYLATSMYAVKCECDIVDHHERRFHKSDGTIPDQ